MEKENKEPTFVKTTYPEDEPWKTNIYFGPKDGTGSHAHLVASGSKVVEIWYLRDSNGTEIIKEGKIIDYQERGIKLKKK